MSRYGIKPLNLKQALELYDILKKFIPNKSKDEHILDFIGKIVNNIAEDKSTAYADALCLMTGESLDVLQGFSSETLLEMFALGLTMNDVIELKKFSEEIHYGD